MNIVLLGYMGSGKSSVGKLLSHTVGIPFLDLDKEIEQQEKAAIQEIFKTKGEIYFRKREAEILQEILLLHQKSVLSIGGGTPCYGNVMQNLIEKNGVLTIYLKCSLETLTNRLWKEKSHRPLISHINTESLLNDFIRKHLFERSFYYNQAHEIITCDGFSEQEIVEKILLRLF